MELKLVPEWLSSKAFPLKIGDAMVRDICVWHGGCPNLSGQPRFLPAAQPCIIAGLCHVLDFQIVAYILHPWYAKKKALLARRGGKAPGY